jgi:hypothetical protein
VSATLEGTAETKLNRIYGLSLHPKRSSIRE